MRHTHAVLAAATLALISLVAPTVASATESVSAPMQKRVNEVIEEHGGEQTGWNEVSWGSSGIVLTIAPDLGSDVKPTGRNLAAAAASKDNCAVGKYCVYSGAFYGGNKLTYSACPAVHTSFGAVGRVRSVKNGRSSGTVRAYSGATVNATLTAGKGNSNISGVTKLTCG